MPTAADAVWAIDLGNSSLKVLHLVAVGDVVQVIGFDNIQHGKVLSGAGVTAAEREELVAISLRQFVQRNDIGNDAIIVSVPSQSSFARFVNLPPVEQKRIPEIVKFEAAQQIPFDINEVVWDWQLMTEAPEKKVGIFAIKNEVVTAALERFEREDLQVSYVQMAPMALYNFLFYDRPDLVGSDDKATVVLNIGAEITDLVVCTQSMAWQRCITMGGNSFTKAIADTFKLNFEKAEKLKRTAPVSKYARQIFQAMRPVFADLAAEVQRSLGFYTTSNPNTKIVKVVAMGGGTKLRGLLKFLEQTLQMPVERVDTFKRVAIAPGVAAAKFHENVSDFGVVYGLALQGLGVARIESNLLPGTVARSMAWASKTKYFIAAACLLLVVSLMCLARAGLDKVNYVRNGQVRQRIDNVIREADHANNIVQQSQSKGGEYEAKIKKEFERFKYRDMIPWLHEVVLSTLPNARNNPGQKALYEAFEKGDTETVIKVPRKERKQIIVTNMSVYFSEDLAKAQFGATAMARKGELSRGIAQTGIDEYERQQQEQMAIEYQMMGYQRGLMPGFGVGTQEVKDPGFVITIAGYSPYREVGELLDPVGMDDKSDKWGVVTRLSHLDKILDKSMIVDGNSPLQLYGKTDIQHFKIEKGSVDLNADMPAGIGVLEAINKNPSTGGTGPVFEPGGRSYDMSGPSMLVDPMTRETISTVTEIDEYGKQKLNIRGEPLTKTNDNWFVLNFKLRWRDAPKDFVTGAKTAAAASAATISTVSPPPSTSKAGSSATKPRRSSRKVGGDFGE
jgi:type IV pilus assembly protein PilM